jgi:hypothetical protein
MGHKDLAEPTTFLNLNLLTILSETMAGKQNTEHSG